MTDVTIHLVDGATIERIESKLNLALQLLSTILQREKTMSVALDNLKQQVANTQGIEQSAVTLIQGIANQMQGSGDADVQALADELQAAAAPLAAAVTANAPAAPAQPTA